MDEQIEQTIHKWVAWTGPVFIVSLLITFMLLGHNYPPPAPSLSPEALVSDYYIKYRSDIKLGMSLTQVFGILYVPWSVQVSILMMRREKSGMLAMIQLIGGLLTAWTFVVCPQKWAYCANAAGVVSPDVIQGIHKEAWYIFDSTFAQLQCLTVGVFALADKKRPAIFPAWAGWVSIAATVSIFPLAFLSFFDEGPFAYDGLFSYWGIFFFWGAYFQVTTYCVFKEVWRPRMSATPGIGQSIGHVARN